MKTKLHTPACLSSGKWLPMSIEQDSKWTSVIMEFLEKKKIACPSRESNQLTA